MITLNKYHKAFKVIEFVAQARTDNKDTRKVMSNIHIDEENIVATNGHIMFYVPNTEKALECEPLPYGQYEYVKIKGEVKLIPVTEPMQYPNYKQIITADLNGYETFCHGIKDANSISIIMAKLGALKTCVNYTYLNKLTSDCWTFYVKDSLSAIVAETDTFKALLMPIRIS
jgi:hypothetical protein